MSDITVAKTISYQINTLDPRAFFAWGAHDLLGIPESSENLGSLEFKARNIPNFRGRVFVNISLKGNDTYTIEVFKRKNFTKKLREKILNGEDVELKKELALVKDIHADQLVSIIDGILG